MNFVLKKIMYVCGYKRMRLQHATKRIGQSSFSFAASLVLTRYFNRMNQYLRYASAQCNQPFSKIIITDDKKWVIYSNIIRKRLWCRDMPVQISSKAELHQKNHAVNLGRSQCCHAAFEEPYYQFRCLLSKRMQLDEAIKEKEL